MADEINTNSNRKRWTRLAKECYNRGCVCSGCYYKDFFSESHSQCQMKKTVIDLVREIGKPNDENSPIETTKEKIYELYVKKKMRLNDIYRILRTNKYEFSEWLRFYGIKQRPKPKF